MFESTYRKYIRTERLPHIWCPGCGNGVVMGSFCRAVDELGYDRNKTVVISGIGCSGRISSYVDFNTMHVTHGRALAFANGVKMADPELNVFVFMGDGDAISIGGNHFIHTCRRNINITAIIINNNTYGMTGGQYSPMTPTGMKATTTTYGSIDRNFDIADLSRAAGATFVGRAGTYQMNLLKNLIAEGADHNGFAVIEAVSQCPVNFGRRNKMADPVNMITWQKENTVPVGRAAKMTPEELDGKIVTGKLYKTDASEYTEEYKKLIDRAMREK